MFHKMNILVILCFEFELKDNSKCTNKEYEKNLTLCGRKSSDAIPFEKQTDISCIYAGFT